MENILRKAVIMGLGLASVSKQKIEEFVKDISNTAKMSEEEGRKWYEELTRESDKARQEMQDKIKQKVDEALRDAEIARKADIDRLEARIKALELKINIYD